MKNMRHGSEFLGDDNFRQSMDEEAGLLSASLADSDRKASPTSGGHAHEQPLLTRYAFGANYIWTIANIVLFWILLQKSGVSVTQCAETLSAFSPAIPYLDYETVKFATFSTESPYKGQPSPEIDAAWDKLDQAGYVPISKKDLITKLGKNETYVSLEGDRGGQYLGSLEVYHQLHCLNLIRKYTYEDYYRKLEQMPVPFHDPDAVLRRHIDHCIDYLREAIMCTADVGVYMSYWVEQRDLPWPDFEVEHKCRRWETVEQYAESVGGSIELPAKPSDAIQYPHPLHPREA